MRLQLGTMVRGVGLRQLMPVPCLHDSARRRAREAGFKRRTVRNHKGDRRPKPSGTQSGFRTMFALWRFRLPTPSVIS